MRKLRRVALVMAAVAVLAGPSVSADGGRGWNRVTSPDASSSGTGYGKGWVALSGPGVNDPIIGNLFYSDNEAGNSPDHMDIFNEPPLTYPRGWAYGQFDGCAYAYTFKNFFREDGTPHRAPCEPPYKDMPKSELFCSSGDALCPAYGAYQTIRDERISAPTPTSCPAYGNLGARAFKGTSASGSPRNLLGHLPDQRPIGIRYVTKDDQWVMVLNASAHPAYQNAVDVNPAYPGLHWVFVPRACIPVPH